MEHFVTWTDTSKIRKHVLEYNEEVCIIVLSVDKVHALKYTHHLYGLWVGWLSSVTKQRNQNILDYTVRAL